MRAKMDCLEKLFLLSCAICIVTPILAAQDDKPVKVALLESVFAGKDRKQVIQQIQPFADIVQRETGRKATFDIYSLKEVEPAFNSGEIQLVILTGLEYGWMRAKNDQARPLLQADIDAGATQTPCFQGLVQCVFIDDFATSHIDEHRVFFHFGERRLVDHATRL